MVWCIYLNEWMVYFLFILDSLLFIVLVFMNEFTWLDVWIREILNKFQLIIFYKQVKVFILYARSVLKEFLAQKR